MSILLSIPEVYSVNYNCDTHNAQEKKSLTFENRVIRQDGKQTKLEPE